MYAYGKLHAILKIKEDHPHTKILERALSRLNADDSTVSIRECLSVLGCTVKKSQWIVELWQKILDIDDNHATNVGALESDSDSASESESSDYDFTPSCDALISLIT